MNLQAPPAVHKDPKTQRPEGQTLFFSCLGAFVHTHGPVQRRTNVIPLTPPESTLKPVTFRAASL